VPPSRARARKPAADHPVSKRGESTTRRKAKARKSIVSAPKPKSRTKRQKKRVDVSARSFAAKKGWLTRRYNQQVKAIEERYERRDKEYQRELRKQVKALAAKEKVIVYTQEQLREKGQEITEKVERAFKKAKTESDEEFKRKLDIMERLWEAQLAGEFDDVAYALAEEYDMEAREIYTLWHYNGGID
jgi:hypothetical protein